MRDFKDTLDSVISISTIGRYWQWNSQPQKSNRSKTKELTLLVISNHTDLVYGWKILERSDIVSQSNLASFINNQSLDRVDLSENVNFGVGEHRQGA